MSYLFPYIFKNACQFVAVLEKIAYFPIIFLTLVILCQKKAGRFVAIFGKLTKSVITVEEFLGVPGEIQKSFFISQ